MDRASTLAARAISIRHLLNLDPLIVRACITLDLEPDFVGRVSGTRYDGWREDRIAQLLDLLGRYEVRLTVFVVGSSLCVRPEVIETLRDFEAEFHLHSYSHDLGNPDSGEEIHRGRESFRDYFGHDPRGYRAPEGRISREGWRRLERAGFLFDSSVIPSVWPRPTYLQFRPEPFYPTRGRLLELPLSTVTPLRLIISVSWMKLFGWPLYRFALERFRLPEPLVVNMHLHDLWALPAFDELAEPWHCIYSRNREAGMTILEQFLDWLSSKEYRFDTVETVVRQRMLEDLSCS